MHQSGMFISYDGLLDPLGGSQILPYIHIVRQKTKRMHVVSFEKADRYAAGAEKLRRELAQKDIGWTPVSFTRKFWKFGKLWDLTRMYAVCLRLQVRDKFDVIHCRSYQAMQVGCLLKTLTGTQTIFDMRGLWVDERVDGGLWSLEKPLDRYAYAAYKRVERRLLRCASAVVVLTQKIVPEIRRIAPKITAPITVIPCCADFAHFRPLSEQERTKVRRRLGIPANAFVLTYLGSLGTWYLLEEMLRFFSDAAQKRADVHFLLITRDWRDEHEALLGKVGLRELRGRIHSMPASRDEAPSFLGASDVMLSFIKPAYSKAASSPTKLAEAFAMGVPVISNTGIGDVDGVTRELDAGALLDLDDPDAIGDLVDRLDEIRAKGGLRLRERARQLFDLEIARQKYHEIYDHLQKLYIDG
jgi:glycosyltransferase involved in cell wall biosynthesis